MQKFRAGDGLHTPMRHSTEDIYFKIDFTFPFGVWTFQVCRGVRRFSIHWFIPFQLKSKVKAREHFTDGPSIAVYCFVEELFEEITKDSPLRSRGPTPSLKDAEVLSPLIVGEFLGLGV